jgi:hypothetical protein
MSASTELAVESEVEVPGPRRTLVVLRVVAALHALDMILQPMLAGMYLSGQVDALTLHSINGDTVAALGLIQLGAAIAFVWRGKGRSWALWATLGVVLAEELQVQFGYAGLIAVHIPLGVSVISLQILLTVWLFRAEAARRRS